MIHALSLLFFLFFFNDTATTEIYTLSLHDALPISEVRRLRNASPRAACCVPSRSIRCQEGGEFLIATAQDRKSTRLNSSHQIISYAVFCFKKKKKSTTTKDTTH